MLEKWPSQENFKRALDIPRETVGHIVCNFKVKGTQATLPGETGSYHQVPYEASDQKPSKNTCR